MPTRGRFVALEGGEGSGKSTQARHLAAALGAVATREPGGTPAGERIRGLVLDPELEIGPVAELLLFAAARAELVRQVVEPALHAGEHVVTDRFSASTIAYQRYGRRLPADLVASVVVVGSAGLEPDLNVLVEVPPEVAAARRRGQPDRIEAAEEGFHERVLAGFAELAAADPQRWAVVDGTGSEEAVARRVLAAVTERLGIAVPSVT